MKPVYEIVRAAELRVGDVVQWNGANCEILGKMQEDDRGDIRFQFHRNGVYFSKKAYYRIELYRQLPSERNPEVLERAIEIASSQVLETTHVMMERKTPFPSKDDARHYAKSCVDKAIRELESEAGDGVQD